MVTEVGVVKFLNFEVREFYPELRFTQRIYPNWCFGKMLLFGAVRVKDQD